MAQGVSKPVATVSILMFACAGVGAAVGAVVGGAMVGDTAVAGAVVGLSVGAAVGIEAVFVGRAGSAVAAGVVAAAAAGVIGVEVIVKLLELHPALTIKTNRRVRATFIRYTPSIL